METQLRVTLNRHQNFTEKELAKLTLAIPLIQKVVNSPAFKEEILFFKFKNEFKFFDTNLSNARVFSTFMGGRQYNETEDDYELDIDLTIYHSRWSSTVGYTYPNTVRTWVNRKFFSSYGLAEIAGNVVHEYCHKLGFEHSVQPTPSRKYSVPYAVGNIVEGLATRFLESGGDMTSIGYKEK